MATNPRYKNGNLRRKNRARFAAMNAPCGICGGRLGRIHYEEPSDYKHPLSFVIDEICPVSKYKAGGYSTREECANDWSNLQAAHWICNAKKSDASTGGRASRSNTEKKFLVNISDGNW